MKRLAPLSLDLDNKWAYLMTHGDKSWESYPSYLNVVVPRVLDFLDERGLKITFFIVGRDAGRSEHSDVLGEIVRRGHHVGNHSFDHRPWLHLYEPDQLADDFDRSETAIQAATGEKPLGFRGPGFSLSNQVIAELANRGYLYDATVFPNVLNPLSRAYYFWKSDLTAEEKKQRKELFGTLGTAFRPNKPHHWVTGGRQVSEVPVTTFPMFRTPIHLSYLSYLGGKSKALGSAYFRMALGACAVSGNRPSMLLHPLDFLGADDEPDLGFFPGMDLEAGKKLDLADHFLSMLEDRYELSPLEEYVASLELARALEPNYD